MAKITYTVEKCRDKISPNCTKTFNREIKRGRPQVNCEACKIFKPSMPRITRPAVTTASIVAAVLGKALCPCGNEFDINPGRGRKPSKCSDCRTAGIVYRADDDGQIQAIQAATLAEEQREKAEQAGKERAQALFERMQPLLRRTDRVVIAH